MNARFETLAPGESLRGEPFAVSRESIRAFCEASLDFNPLHLDEAYMQGSFGGTTFGGVIMHGMNNLGILTRMLTDWAHAAGAIQRRLETRWLAPVKPGDVIRPHATVKAKQVTARSRWVTLDVEVRNQRDEKVAAGEALVEFPGVASEVE